VVVAYTVEVVKDVEVLVADEDSDPDGEALPVAGEALPGAEVDCPSVAVTGQIVV